MNREGQPALQAHSPGHTEDSRRHHQQGTRGHGAWMGACHRTGRVTPARLPGADTLPSSGLPGPWPGGGRSGGCPVPGPRTCWKRPPFCALRTVGTRQAPCQGHAAPAPHTGMSSVPWVLTRTLVTGVRADAGVQHDLISRPRPGPSAKAPLPERLRCGSGGRVSWAPPPGACATSTSVRREARGRAAHPGGAAGCSRSPSPAERRRTPPAARPLLRGGPETSVTLTAQPHFGGPDVLTLSRTSCARPEGSGDERP